VLVILANAAVLTKADVLLVVRSVTAGRASHAGAWSTRFHCIRHKAASEVRYVVIFNNGSTTEPNGVSELSLAPHRTTVLTTNY
jgi:hypothetical protein